MIRKTSVKAPRRKRRKPDEPFDRLVSKIKQRFARVPPQKATALIDEAVRATRKKRGRQ